MKKGEILYATAFNVFAGDVEEIIAFLRAKVKEELELFKVNPTFAEVIANRISFRFEPIWEGDNSKLKVFAEFEELDLGECGQMEFLFSLESIHSLKPVFVVSGIEKEGKFLESLREFTRITLLPRLIELFQRLQVDKK